MIHNTADVVAQLLVVAGKAVLLDKDVTTWKWKIHTSIVPDVPNDVLTVYNTQGVKVGRINNTKRTIHSPAIQIMSRSSNDKRGFYVLELIRLYFDTVTNTEVEVPAKIVDSVNIPTATYKIFSINQRSSIISAGQDDKKRFLNTLNCVLRINQTVP